MPRGRKSTRKEPTVETPTAVAEPKAPAEDQAVTTRTAEPAPERAAPASVPPEAAPVEAAAPATTQPARPADQPKGATMSLRQLQQETMPTLQKTGPQ